MKQILYCSKNYNQSDLDIERLINGLLTTLQRTQHQILDVLIPNKTEFCIVYDCPILDDIKMTCSDESIICRELREW